MRVYVVSALTLCYTSLGLANKLLSGLRADDSADTRARNGWRGVVTRASRLIARLPFSAARGGEKGKEKSDDGKSKRRD